MKRRRVLLATSVVLSTGVAGCSDDETGDVGTDGEGRDQDAPGDDGSDGSATPDGDDDGGLVDQVTDDDGDDASTDQDGADDGTATETGEESTEVGGRLQVLSTVGRVEDGIVTAVEITVSKAPGSGDVDVEAVTVQLVGPDGATRFTHRTVATDDQTFAHEPLRDPDDTDPVMSASEDRFVLTFELGNGSHPPLQEGDTAELELTTGTDARTQVVLSVPASLAGEEAVAL